MSSERGSTRVQIVVRVEVPQVGLAEAGLEVAQEEIDGALLLIIIPAIVDGAAQADQLIAHARGRLPVTALVLEHRSMRARAAILQCKPLASEILSDLRDSQYPYEWML